GELLGAGFSLRTTLPWNGRVGRRFGALPPRPQDLIPPRGTAPGATGASPFFAARARAALPGVRGPPGAEAGQPALHRSRCTDLSSRRPSL
ncbi:hypothetical protein AB0K87_35350, partial [Streptomyces sp. NPDC053705]